MDHQNLKNKIHIILNEKQNNRISWELEDDTTSVYDEITKKDIDANFPIVNKPYKYSLISQNYLLLKSLLDVLQNDIERKFFYDELIIHHHANRGSPLILIFNIKTIGIEEALKLHLDSFRESNGDFHCILALNEYIRYAHHTLSDLDVDAIERYVDKLLQGEKIKSEYFAFNSELSYIKEQLQKIRYKRLSLDLLEGINFEINQDREEVKHYLQKFKFKPELIESIQFVENSYQSAKSDFDYKTCADQLRIFTSELTKEIALKIADHDSESNIGNKYYKYLHDKHFFNSGKESELFKSFISYLSLDSVHRLSGEREMARISKNLVIEFALLLSQRLEVYLQKE